MTSVQQQAVLLDSIAYGALIGATNIGRAGGGMSAMSLGVLRTVRRGCVRDF